MQMPTTPDRDFDEYNTRRLRALETELIDAQNRQEAAAAVSTSLSQRASAFQKSAATAQVAAAAATANLAAAQATTQTVEQGVPLASDAQDQAVIIAAEINPVLVKAHETSLLAIDALTAIDALVAQVSRRKGKNELISPLVTSGATQSQNDAATALAAITTALQNTMLAVAVSQEAQTASGQVIDASRRLRKLLAPTHPTFDATQPASEHLWDDTTHPIETIRDLANTIRTQDLSILAVLDALQRIALQMAAEQQSAATQANLALNAANDTLNRATARARSASASLTAAEAAVA
jgi:hypothetical protein